MLPDGGDHQRNDGATILYLVWARYHRRAELLAQHLGAQVRYLSSGSRGKLYQVPFRYLALTWRTWRLLWRERPQVVMVQNPPIFAVSAAAVYAFLCRARYAIDSHTGAFLSPGWRRTLWLHRLLSRGAAVTVVHNRDQEDIVRSWGCRWCRVGYTPGDYPRREPFDLAERPAVAVVCSYAEDEPVAEIFRAASALNEVGFYITGNEKHLSPALRAELPANCHLTGFLAYERYIELLRAADIVMVLTKRNHTLLMGGFETVSLGKPLVTSEWPVLRDFFSAGTVHVHGTAEDIAAGVRRALSERDGLESEMVGLRQRLEADWREELATLQTALA